MLEDTDVLFRTNPSVPREKVDGVPWASANACMLSLLMDRCAFKGKTTYSLLANDGGKVASFNIAYKERGEQRYLDLQGRKHSNLDDLVHGAMRRWV